MDLRSDLSEAALDAHEQKNFIGNGNLCAHRSACFNGEASENLFIAFNNSTLLAEAFIHR